MASANAPSKETTTEEPKTQVNFFFNSDKTLSEQGQFLFQNHKTIGSFLSWMGSESDVLSVFKDRFSKEQEFAKKWDECFQTRDLHQIPITRDYFIICDEYKIPYGFEITIQPPRMNYMMGTAISMEKPAAMTMTSNPDDGEEDDDNPDDDEEEDDDDNPDLP